MANKEPTLFDAFDEEAQQAAERVVSGDPAGTEAWDGTKFHRDYRKTPSTGELRQQTEAEEMMARYDQPPSSAEFRQQKIAEVRATLMEKPSINLYGAEPPKPARPAPGSNNPAT